MDATSSAYSTSELAIPGHLVEQRLTALFDQERARWTTVDADLDAPFAILAEFAAHGGKRIRPAFCYWAYVGTGGNPEDPAIAELCSALELLHVFALLHDDVMDGSRTRRNRPTVHIAIEAHHLAQGWRGEARRFGEGMATLLGDLAFTYADLLTDELPRAVLRLYTELRVELVVGQYLDLQSAARGDADVERARRIAVHKSGKYTVERPLQLGATLTGRVDQLDPGLSTFGLTLGEAFQLRDDLLGAFGDEEVIGKPVGDDLREGKATPLLTLAVDRAGPAAQEVLARVGQPDLTEADIDAIREQLEATGARAAIEDRITRLVADAMVALDQLTLTAEARTALAGLAQFVAWRDR